MHERRFSRDANHLGLPGWSNKDHDSMKKQSEDNAVDGRLRSSEDMLSSAMRASFISVASCNRDGDQGKYSELDMMKKEMQYAAALEV